jgi:hypothetical protein
MALNYQTEYRFGRRGRCVTRTYGGVRALVAIAADLTLSLVFGVFGLAFRVVGWSLRLAWHLCRLAVLALWDVILTLARFVREVITLPWRMSNRHPGRTAYKPSAGAFVEL